MGVAELLEELPIDVPEDLIDKAQTKINAYLPVIIPRAYGVVPTVVGVVPIAIVVVTVTHIMEYVCVQEAVGGIGDKVFLKG